GPSNTTRKVSSLVKIVSLLSFAGSLMINLAAERRICAWLWDHRLRTGLRRTTPALETSSPEHERRSAPRPICLGIGVGAASGTYLPLPQAAGEPDGAWHPPDRL